MRTIAKLTRKRLQRIDPRTRQPHGRALRIVLGLGLLALLAVGPVPGWGLWGLVGLVPLFTGAVGSCPAALRALSPGEKGSA